MREKVGIQVGSEKYPPCLVCRKKEDDKANRTCEECEANAYYIQAVDGDEKAIEFLKGLSPGMLGIELPEYVKPEKIKAGPDYYEEKYYAEMKLKAKALYNIEFETFRDILITMYRHIRSKQKVGEMLGIPRGSIYYICDVFKIKTLTS